MLTTKKVSEMFNVSEETVRRWIRSGELEAVQDGKIYKIDQASLIKFIDKKVKEPGNSISKMGFITGIADKEEDSTTVASKLIEFGAAVVAKNIKMWLPFDQVPEDPEELSIYYLKNLIYFRKLDMERLEHEHKIKSLDIKEEIAKYELILQMKLNDKKEGEKMD
ncbi:helix-turn-helix domain-containing protein [Neobacillus sp. NRS-1170]|uniref:helix-turn-helix domain-containing protein n=1 Tax=Neobacillus sp. NRS-1170 TaxID=3233898 RepID=UPI003D2E2EA1